MLGTTPGILAAVIDQEGVYELVKIAAERGRATRPGIKLGTFGEHGGDPASTAFCEKVGLDYVSCSPNPRADRPPRRRPGGARASTGKAMIGGSEQAFTDHSSTGIHRARATQQSLSLPGQARRAQAGAVHVSARALEGTAKQMQ